MGKSDLEINQAAKLLPIEEVAKKIGIPASALEYYGKAKAKISLEFCNSVSSNPNGKLILVTAINPTQAGEGKTTTAIGLADALKRLGKRVSTAIRQPSLGPVFGVKGGATGGGKAQVAPMEDIDLHFTGDFDAVAAAHNLIAAVADNAIFQKTIDLDPKRMVWRRVMDMNDRSLRNVIVGLGKPADGIAHENGFDITAASEIMAILCLSKSIKELKEKISNILVGFSSTGKPVFCRDLKCAGAAAALLKDAIKPNLVQTIENTPAFIHGGPFANIAQGYNCIVTTQLALKLNEIVTTEAGFGADLGAEKFFDLVCPYAGFIPSMMVLVVTVRALKLHGGQPFELCSQENLDALNKGLENLGHHIELGRKFGVDVIVTINKYITDSPKEVQMILDFCKTHSCDVALSDVWGQGGAGGEELAKLVLSHFEANGDNISKYRPIYNWSDTVENKIKIVAKEVYGAKDVEFASEALEDIEMIKKLSMANLPLCIAKTQYSLSDNPKLLGAPKNFILKVKKIVIASGAGFLVPMTGDILRMPGLPKIPAAEAIDIDENGVIKGLF
jgi:formate--tetrahydrofolate ligase